MYSQAQRLREAIDGFLSAFRDLDWGPFIAAFAPEATVFLPFANAPRRADGIEQIKAVFAPYFADLRGRHSAGPPYLRLEPADLQLTISGELALLSFHLHDAVAGQTVLCRRTFVWVEQGAQWRILHLHASNLEITASE